MTLTELGWTDALATAFEPFAVDGFVPARVSVAYGATFRVMHERGDELADSAGRLRHDAQTRRDMPAVGDWVAVKPSTSAGGRATIHAVLPRKSLFSRKAAGDETAEQIVASNVDVAFLMTAFDHDFNLRRLERYLTMTWESGAQPVILLNKQDLTEDAMVHLEEVARIASGVPVHAMSARDETGLEALAPYLRPGVTIALLGSSGVGKSTLINRLLGEDRLATAAVRENDQRGRHTTTHRELVPLPGGALLIDTPGMRELQLWSADSGIAETFDDISALAAGCSFGNCQHDQEPRCAVKQAVADGRLPAKRLESFLKLRAELVALTARQDVLAQQTRKRRDKVITRAVRKHLQTKDHS
jgi:ribosome biogenesis GTPase